MKKKPELTDEEIRSHMDFDKLLHLSKTTGAALASTTPKWLSITAYTVPAVAVVVTSALYFSKPGSQMAEKPIQSREQNNLAIADTTATVEPLAETKINETTEEQVAKPIVTTDRKAENQEKPKIEKLTVPKFTQAEPVDGYPALYEYFNRELKYPIEMTKDSIEGVVTVSFAINEEGKPTDIRISNSLGTKFDQESIRVIENMPAWRAATINGKATVTRMSIPLTFQIKR